MASLVLGGQLAWADTPSPPFAGVWAGTIGTARVQVCLAGDDSTEYYYLRHKRGIRLQASGAADNPRNEDLIAKALGSGRLELDERSTGTTLERRFTGRWKLQPDDRGGLSGTWSAPGGGQPLPVQLARLTRPFKTRESYPGGDPCHPSFYEPLKSGLRFTYSAAAFEGHLYRGVATGQAVAFEVPADTPHAAKINAYAIDWLKNQAVLAYQCDIGRGAGEAALDSSLTPLV
jgi:hypothetical protein